MENVNCLFQFADQNCSFVERLCKNSAQQIFVSAISRSLFVFFMRVKFLTFKLFDQALLYKKKIGQINSFNHQNETVNANMIKGKRLDFISKKEERIENATLVRVLTLVDIV